MGEVKDITQRLERWSEAHRTSDLVVKVSSHGRLMLSSDEGSMVLSFVDSMRCLQGVLSEYKRYGFGVDDGPQGSEPVAGSAR